MGSNDDDFWGEYQSSHIYSYEFLGAGNPIDFYVNDVDLGSGSDNDGIFTVRIFRESDIPEPPATTPEPSTILALATLGVGTFFKRKLANKQN